MNTDRMPTVSRAFNDGTLVETLYDAATATTMFAVRLPDGSTSTCNTFDAPTGERLVPYAATNNLLTTGCVLLPSGIGEMGDVGELVRDIGHYLERYVALTPAFRELVPYYVLLTWVYDAFNELGYLRLRGGWGSGKTRALISIGSICNKPFFASGASTVSPIFHILDAMGGTLILDEADLRFSDATADLTKILNNGNVAGLPVLRTMTVRARELSPRAFNIYGPKILAMRERFQDDALESRFLTEETGSVPLPTHIPIHLPQTLKIEAQALRNRLLAWRLRERWNIAPKPDRLIAGASPRTNQTALAMLSLIDDAQVRDRVAHFVCGIEDDRAQARLETEDGRMVAALATAFAETTTPSVPISAVAHIFNSKSLEFSYLPLSNKSVGWIIRTRLRIATIKSHGVFVVPHNERQSVQMLAARYGLTAHAAAEAVEIADLSASREDGETGTIESAV